METIRSPQTSLCCLISGVFEGGSAVSFLGVNFIVEILWIGSGLAGFQGGFSLKLTHETW
jgi:hypothetical protein